MTTSKAVIMALGLIAVGLTWWFSADVDGPNYPTAAVTGSVTLDDQPLTNAIVRFVPVKGTPGNKWSVEIRDGQFSSNTGHGPAIGNHRIEVESTDNGGFAFDDEAGLERLKNQQDNDLDVVLIPPAYNHRSQLTATVTADGPNEFNFALDTDD